MPISIQGVNIDGGFSLVGPNFTVPDAPTIGTVTTSGTTASVPFTAPAYDGNTPIISYTAVSTPGSITATLTQSGSGTISVTGLTKGVSYTFVVFATNAEGNSANSNTSNSVIPLTAPNEPTNIVATGGAAQASVSFTAPTDNGGTTITSYTVTSTPGNITATGSSSPITVTGLTNGTSYTFNVKATNSVGTGPASVESNSVTPLSVPAAPTIGTATITSGTSVDVTYTAPLNNGGTVITSYTAVSTPGNITATISQSGSGTISVTGLTKGTAYTFVVYATNSVGNSANSAASNSVTPSTVPNAPTIGTATATGQTTATVSFTAPGDNGGRTITSYTAVSTPGNRTGTLNQAGSGTITVTGLTPGTSYTFVVYATNALGNSANSSASNSITTPVPNGEQTYTSAGTYSWTAPAGVTSVSVVCVGTGGTGGSSSGDFGGGGGGLGYKNNITVVPGNSYTVVVGAKIGYGVAGASGDSYFINTSTVAGRGGNSGKAPGPNVGRGGSYVGDGGGSGGNGGVGASSPNGSGGGGAGGYSGNGGGGGQGTGSASAGSGGGGGGGYGGTNGAGGGGSGGGVGLFGQGSSGAAGTSTSFGGKGGSGGTNGGVGSNSSAGQYGGGSAYGIGTGSAGIGAVRIVWPGTTRQFPSTNVA